MQMGDNAPEMQMGALGLDRLHTHHTWYEIYWPKMKWESAAAKPSIDVSTAHS
jgi:hypothetical protein